MDRCCVIFLLGSPDEEASVMAALAVASSMQSIHTVLRQQQNHSGVQISGYKVCCDGVCFEHLTVFRWSSVMIDVRR
jgi:hypothetical protein